MEMISNHISYYEATHSPTATEKGLNNEPNLTQLKAMRLVAVKCFEPLRMWANVPLSINSFFRGEALNKAIGGSLTSQHCKGEAIDIDGKGKISNAKIFHFLKENTEFDQLIAEFPVNGEPAWVHVSYSERGNRGQILVATKVKGKTVYSPYKRGDVNL
jgi:hypothetical protein